MKKKLRIFACDFETTVYKEQEETEVWASAAVELYSEEKPVVLSSIDETYEYFASFNESVILYYHNLKFDGSFWLDFLLRKKRMKQAYEPVSCDSVKWVKDRNMPRESFKYAISNVGQWYTMTVRTKAGHYIYIKDSVKLMPLSLKKIGESFKTPHQKLEMEYHGKRYAGWKCSPEELAYIENDVYVLKEALEIMFAEGHDKLTIGSCCLYEFKSLYGKQEYEEFFPNLYDIYLPDEYGYPTAGDYIRACYRGAWTYLVRGKENKRFAGGVTADANSLYPSMMHSSSGNVYPVGKPCFWSGNIIPKEAIAPNKYYYLRVRCSFHIKQGMLPTIQIKNNWLYPPREFLDSSDVKIGGTYYRYRQENGVIMPVTVTLNLSCTDYRLLHAHYVVENEEILDGCYFYAEPGLFDRYIDKYMRIKEESTGARRTIAKLFLNNLYGKLASSPNSSFKLAYLEDGEVKFRYIHEEDKTPGYIAAGAAVTSYARACTIGKAQANYHGLDEPGFIYADTDSLHCDLPEYALAQIEIHPSHLNCWKVETHWDEAIFVRAKTYIEHVIEENGEPCDPHYNITCAGMPDKCKQLLEISFNGDALIKRNRKTWDTNFLLNEDGEPVVRSMDDFKRGLKVPLKLCQKRIKGGIILNETDFTIK